MFDIIFISYDEPNADENWKLLREIAPHAKRVHGVKGIAQAHIEAAKEVSTSHFFTVDGDNVVGDDFNWEKIIDFQKNDRRVHVWQCTNAVNNLIYGYGGIKLWPTDHIEHIQEYATDFTTSVATHGFKLHLDVASITHFNTTPFNAWRSGFREAAKLASGNMTDERSCNRLSVWMNIGVDVEFGHDCMYGARCGALFGKEYSDDLQMMTKINDFDWLSKEYDNYYQSKLFEEITKQLEIYNLIPVKFFREQSLFFKQNMYNL